MKQDSGLDTQESVMGSGLSRSAVLTATVAACLVVTSLAGAQERAPRRAAPPHVATKRDTAGPVLKPEEPPPPPRALRRLPLAQRAVTPAAPRPMQAPSAPPRRPSAARAAAPELSRAVNSMRPNIPPPPAPGTGGQLPSIEANRALPQADAPPPAGSTMRCRDGTYLSGPPSETACSGHQGLAVRLPAGRTPPPQPAAAAQRRP